MFPGPQSEQSDELLTIREDLKLIRGAGLSSGKPSWLIFDPVAHRYMRIDIWSYRVFQAWKQFRSRQQLIDYLEQEEYFEDPSGIVDKFSEFIVQYSLVHESKYNPREMAARQRARKVNPLKWMVKNYLFVKVPIIAPDKFLAKTKWIAKFFISKGFVVFLVVAAVLGIYLVARQWDTFVNTFVEFYSLQGLLYFGSALIVTKIIHEMGHAYAASLNNCKVPSMGIAFLVMFPVLYTDLTDTWKLRSRKRRFLISAAGVICELSLAIIATFLWAFVPDGYFRSALFATAVVGWLLSVLVNFNPLMRFDGYYMFSDMVGVDNLQSTSFDVGKNWMRNILFGIPLAKIRGVPAEKIKLLVAYAWAVWIYRFFLFLGIALLVYFMFFKVLGVILFIVEIIWFIAMPIAKEMMEIWKKRDSAQPRRILLTGTIVACGILFGSLPLSTTVDAPTVLEFKDAENIYSSASGRVEDVHVKNGDYVEVGDSIADIYSSELLERLAGAEIALELAEKGLRSVPVDQRAAIGKNQLDRKYLAARGLVNGYQQLLRENRIRASVSGTVRDFDDDVVKGTYVGSGKLIASIVGGQQIIGNGYVSEDDISRISVGDTARYIPNDVTGKSMELVIASISEDLAETIPYPYLSSEYGGTIDVKEAGAPVNGYFKVSFSAPGIDGEPISTGSVGVGAPLNLSSSSKAVALRDSADARASNESFMVGAGLVKIDGERQSYLGRVARRVIAVIVRETGA